MNNYYYNISRFLPEYDFINKQRLDFNEHILNWIENYKQEFSYKFEKDFLLTIILIKISKEEKYKSIVFKWGTCLNKVYFSYFRLSEDLDFVLTNTFPSEKKTRIKELRKLKNYLIEDLKVLWLEILNPYNNTKADKLLRLLTFEYNSLIDNSKQTIKIDISWKEPLLKEPYNWKIKAVFKEPLLWEPLFNENHYINCIDIKESVAEKLRAAQTRKRAAIRDFFDLFYMKEIQNFDFKDNEFLNLYKEKMKYADNFTPLLEIKKDLKVKVETELYPVLLDRFWFNFEDIFDFVVNFNKNNNIDFKINN